MNQRTPVSVCLIAGNEARRIRAALESVSGWVEEIIVLLNDDVNDGTDRIAESFGAKVFREPWKGHIAQKNSAAQKATQTWLLGLDADEAISPALRAEIQELFARPDKLRSLCCVQFSALHALLRAMDPARRLVSGPANSALAQRAGGVGWS